MEERKEPEPGIDDLSCLEADGEPSPLFDVLLADGGLATSHNVSLAIPSCNDAAQSEAARRQLELMAGMQRALQQAPIRPALKDKSKMSEKQSDQQSSFASARGESLLDIPANGSMNGTFGQPSIEEEKGEGQD